MNKIILVSLDLVDKNIKNNYYLEFINKMKFDIESSSNGNINLFIFYSRNPNRVKEVKNKFPYPQLIENKKVFFCTRNVVKNFIKDNHAKYFTIISNKNIDFQMAVNSKILYLFPAWMPNPETNAEKYGINVSNPLQLFNFIDTLNNQNYWYSKLELPDGTLVLSLSDARSRYQFPNSDEEREVIEEFHKILKQGNRNYYEMFLYHFLSSISNSNLFQDIHYWGFFPSSGLDIEKTEMFIFKERVRYMMKSKPSQHFDYKKHPNLIIRHTPTNKSHFTGKQQRINIGAKKHFDTIRLNEGYKHLFKGKNVCIFDDYLTHGNSFEAARNLLKKAGVNKIIFVTLGRFVNEYQYQDYDIQGDIFSNNYDYKLINRKIIGLDNFKINIKAKVEVENLYEIFNL